MQGLDILLFPDNRNNHINRNNGIHAQLIKILRLRFSQKLQLEREHLVGLAVLSSQVN